ncbi:hypothetical protein SAMN05216218_113119 [Halorientalis regularis]|uniref:Uncharacterized protein n=1 Tax=Halorientalis regularis TaxID=660518 RepID=A0A1G7QVV7_9EURY|nr:hypothetical protein SAMN05216218_113119 [Halorientalis regularis]
MRRQLLQTTLLFSYPILLYNSKRSYLKLSVIELILLRYLERKLMTNQLPDVEFRWKRWVRVPETGS